MDQQHLDFYNFIYFILKIGQILLHFSALDFLYGLICSIQLDSSVHSSCEK